MNERTKDGREAPLCYFSLFNKVLPISLVFFFLDLIITVLFFAFLPVNGTLITKYIVQLVVKLKDHGNDDIT